MNYYDGMSSSHGLLDSNSSSNSRNHRHSDTDDAEETMAESTTPSGGGIGDRDRLGVELGGSAPSSSSAASPAGSGAAPPPPVAYLSIRKQPPSHVFSDEPFEIEFGIEAARGSSDSPPTNVSVQATLVTTTMVTTDAVEVAPVAPPAAGEGGGGNLPRPPPPPPHYPPLSLSVLEEPRISASRRTGKLRCRVKTFACTSSSSDPLLLAPTTSSAAAAFAIRLSTKEGIVMEVTTHTVHVVSAKLRVLADHWNPIWYKDEGGRDKCMEVHVQVCDANDRIVDDASGPLRLTLCYDDRDRSSYAAVTNQELLRPVGARQTAVLEGGRARVRFRIEDVSKNHQGQDFCVRIDATTYPPFSIAPGYTPSVSVRSKRNKRQRVSGVGSGGSVGVPPSFGGMETLGSGGGGGVGGSTDASASMASQVLTSRQSRSSFDPSYLHHPQQHNSRGMMLEGTSPTEQEALVRGAIQGVAQWADDVVNTLYNLQWQVLGYAQNADGSPDYSRPYHSMPNPNQPISRILSQFSDTTRNQIRLLEEVVAAQGVLNSSGGGGGGGGGSIAAAASAATSSAPSALDSPYSASMMHAMDPYGSMMMMMMPGPPPPPPPQQHHHRMSGLPPPHLHQHLSSSAQQAPVPMRMATAGGMPPHLMDAPPSLSYRDYPPPPSLPMPPHHGDYYGAGGRMHPSPSTMQQSHHLQGPGAGTAVSSSLGPVRYDINPGSGASATSAVVVAATTTPAASSAATPADDDDGDADDRRGASVGADEDSADDDNSGEEEYAEANVEYVLAKQYKSLRTGEHLGFPAFSVRRRLVGFYREATEGVGGVGAAGGAPGAIAGGRGGSMRRPLKFAPFSRSAVDRDEISQQASAVLQKAMAGRSEALHALKDWGSITSMVDHALVYDWSKDMPSSSSLSSSRSPAETASATRPRPGSSS